MDSLPPYLQTVASSFWASGKIFLLCFAIFIPLAYFLPANRQPLFRRDMAADTLYWFLGPLLYTPATVFFLILIVPFFYTMGTANHVFHYGNAPFNTWPLLVQAILILFITDFFQYWIHRLYHNAPLWKFHAVHHSPVNLDWLSSARFHPLNTLFYSTLVNACVLLIGFSPESMAILLPFNVIYSPLVHANLKWSYGPFKYVLASPVFHRWHHTHPNEGGNKNFAPTFPIIDLVFGTFYMPKGRIPEKFGTEYDIVPDTFIGQLAYPFHRKVKK